MNTRARPRARCAWANLHELFVPYHDLEWGVPVHDDRLLFEMLNLEGAQAGLSWLIILRKRHSYRLAFDQFDARKIIRYTPARRAKLMRNEGIVRNRLKINAVIENAKTYLAVQRELGSFDRYIWHFVDGKTIPHQERAKALAISHVMSRELKKKGFRFVGPTICFAFMQAVGMVDDHTPDCFRSKSKLKRRK